MSLLRDTPLPSANAGQRSQPTRVSGTSHSDVPIEPLARIALLSRCPKLTTQVVRLAERQAFSLTCIDRTNVIELATAAAIHSVVLHWRAGEFDGLECCKLLRKRDGSIPIPILILSDWKHEAALSMALEAGADAYLPLPVSSRELALRLESLRLPSSPIGYGDCLINGELVLDQRAYRVTHAGQRIALRISEFRLLRELMRHPGTALSNDCLAERLGPKGSRVDARTVRYAIAALRNQLAIARAPNRVRAVPRRGYILD